jgi:energy-coupling factor transporter ATP-binding protein EcfA2
VKIISYEAHNVLGVKDVKFDMEGRHLFLVGGANGQGKTSALTALVMALAGKSGMKGYPEVALRSGEKKGKVVVELSGDEDLQDAAGFTAELTWRKKASGKIEEDFRLLDSAGAEAPEPRTLLKRLFQLKAFDPLEFARMKPKEQATCVQEMLGLDLSKYDKEHQSVFDERTAVGRGRQEASGAVGWHDKAQGRSQGGGKGFGSAGADRRAQCRPG